MPKVMKGWKISRLHILAEVRCILAHEGMVFFYSLFQYNFWVLDGFPHVRNSVCKAKGPGFLVMGLSDFRTALKMKSFLRQRKGKKNKSKVTK